MAVSKINAVFAVHSEQQPRRGKMMLQIMQQNFLLYGMAAMGILGVISQVILRIVYEGLIRDMENPALAKGKYMKQLKQKYNLYRRTQTGPDSIRIFIQKSMMQYKFAGMNLHTWNRMGLFVLALCMAAGIGGWYMAGKFQMGEQLRQNYLWAMLAGSLMIAGAYGIADTPYRRKYLETGLRSMFTNSSTQAVQPVNLSESSRMPEKRPAVPVSTAPEPVKKRSRFIETKAQRDKRELKENLARLKEGMAESAATERHKERNTEILRQMDSSEQERVIREVLKEFLG